MTKQEKVMIMKLIEDLEYTQTNDEGNLSCCYVDRIMFPHHPHREDCRYEYLNKLRNIVGYGRNI